MLNGDVPTTVHLFFHEYPVLTIPFGKAIRDDYPVTFRTSYAWQSIAGNLYIGYFKIITESDVYAIPVGRCIKAAAYDFGITDVRQIEIMMETRTRHYTGAIITDVTFLYTDIFSAYYRQTVLSEILYRDILEWDIL